MSVKSFLANLFTSETVPHSAYNFWPICDSYEYTQISAGQTYFAPALTTLSSLLLRNTVQNGMYVCFLAGKRQFVFTIHGKSWILMLRFIHHSFFMCGVKDVCDDCDVRFTVTTENAGYDAFNTIVLNAFFDYQCNVPSLLCYEQFCVVPQL